MNNYRGPVITCGVEVIDLTVLGTEHPSLSNLADVGS